MGLTSRRHSPGVERLATLCGANADSFEKAAELLVEASGIDLSESTVERVTGRSPHERSRTFRERVS